MAKRPPAKTSHGTRREAQRPAEMDQRRIEAQAAGCTFYIGDICDKDPSHGGVRYTNTGRCAECNRAYFRVNQKERYAKRKTGAASLLQTDPDAFTYVAFTLGDVNAIRRWRESISRKLGATL